MIKSTDTRMHAFPWSFVLASVMPFLSDKQSALTGSIIFKETNYIPIL